MKGTEAVAKETARDAIRREIRETEEYLRSLYRALDLVPARPFHAEGYDEVKLILSMVDVKGMNPPIKAIEKILDVVNKPLSKDTLYGCLLRGGALLGNKYGEKSVKQSISTNVNLRKLKVINRRVGLGDWPDSKWQEQH